MKILKIKLDNTRYIWYYLYVSMTRVKPILIKGVCKMGAEIFKAFEDRELTVSDVVIAKFTHNTKLYVAKRLCSFYPNTSQKNSVANQGIKLVYQRLIRQACEVKQGIKKVTSGGKSVDLSTIDSV